jgi:glycosyltransferase involved in cell wall biosynthesis
MGLRIGILGTRGIPNHYGGFEQVASYLSPLLVERGHTVTVYSPHDHPYREDTWKGVRIIRCYSPAGTAGQFVYDLKCLLDAQKRNFDVLLLLGYTSSSVWGRWYPKGPVIINNMDGLEWKRSKYSRPVRAFLRYAEALAVRFSEYYIADSTAIRDYLQWQYGIHSQFIPYGAELLSGEDRAVLRKWGLTKGRYALIMARMEPENNIEMVLEGFCQSRREKKLVVIGDTDNRYGKYLLQRFGHEPGVIFAGPVFDQQILHSLKFFSALYFHGHSVGGTNPSLLEAMASTALIAAHDNPFNKAILGGDAWYFSDRAAVTRLLERGARGVAEAAMVNNNLEKIGALYNWDRVTSEYEQFMYACYAEKRQLLSYPAFPGLSPL